MFRAPEVTVLTIGIVITISLGASAIDKSEEEKDPAERWAPQEIRIDDMLRKHFLKSRMKNNFVASHASSPQSPAVRDAEEFEDVDAQYGQRQYIPSKRAYTPSKRAYSNMRSKMLDLAQQRLRQKNEKRPSDIHPLNVGMGKSTSSMAWDTLAGILADEYTKQEKQPTHELRFIGK